MGVNSGYDMLCDYFQQVSGGNHVNISRPAATPFPGVLNRVVSRGIKYFRKSSSYDSISLATEMKAMRQLIRRPVDLTHVLYVERTFGILPKLSPRVRGELVGTAHQPFYLFNQRRPSRQ